jgi:hypothetical protein
MPSSITDNSDLPSASWQVATGVVGALFSASVAATSWVVSAAHVSTWFRVIVVAVALAGVVVHSARARSGVQRLRRREEQEREDGNRGDGTKEGGAL